jgi:8-oxo-dGTP pyrophosphatase MutT (NUDIX family)
VLSREQIADFGLFTVEARQARSPRTDAIRPIRVINFPDWVMVLPVTADGDVVMVRQYRHGIERVCLELPGGLVDPQDPDPGRSAARELLEETGHAAEELVWLGKCYPQPAVLSNAGFFYLADGARRVAQPALDAGEDIEIVRVALEQVPAMIDDGRIDHAMVVAAFGYYRRWEQTAAKAGSAEWDGI